MLMAALDETGGRPERAVMIGDTEYDIVMGRAAGVRTIGVAWGYHAPDRLRAAGADAVVTDFPELERLITEVAA
jgi:phosphoglycolate phosphatase